MCSITGMVDFACSSETTTNINILKTMGKELSHRGPDQYGMFVSGDFGFFHNRLAIMDVENGIQPMTIFHEGCEYTIVYNGEIYNTVELRKELESYGVVFKTHCDTEVVLYSYIIFGSECSEKLNGIFAFGVLDNKKNSLYLSRDRFGVKPLFYTKISNTFIFASEIKGLLKHPLVKAEVNEEGLWQLLFLSPVKINGSGVFKNIYELPQASHAIYDDKGLKISTYWKLTAFENNEDETEIIEKTRFLLTDAITRQLVSDVPLCTFLSGGLDSSIITSVASREYAKNGQKLSTYSFEYEGNKEHFSKTMFQPQSDDDYASYLADYLGTNHTILTAKIDDVAELLFDAVKYRDLPGMADIDSSLLYYCKQVKQNHKVAISGECADEIFGGYPWFYRDDMQNNDFFPWNHNPLKRAELFDPSIINPQKGFEYIKDVYKTSLNNCPVLFSDSNEMRKSRYATWLSVNYFMTSLLERKDRMSMGVGLEVRVPFADHRLIEYVYNVPWNIKYQNSTEKSLLRNAMSDYLPDKILNRKKSPYPKTHNPKYEKLVIEILNERLLPSNSVVKRLLNADALEGILNDKSNTTWFGQLMSKPQLIAWLIQFDYWFELYNVSIV